MKRVSAALSDAAAGGLLLLGTGGAVGLALGTRFWVTRAEDFLLHNRVPGGQRLPLLVLGASFALALAAGPAFAWLAGRIPASRLREIAARLSPLLPAALASLLLAPFVWSRARLVHLVACAVLAWLTQRCLRARALAPGLAVEEWLARRVRDSALAGRARAAAQRTALPALLVLAGGDRKSVV